MAELVELTSTDDSASPAVAPGRASLSGRSELAAAAVFYGYLAVAAVLLVRWNSYTWFFSDDWSWLGERDVRSFDDLMRSYNDHWSTIPFIFWRVLYRLFGVGSYTPYLVALIASHLAVVACVRMVMRRSGVGPWMATAVAAPLVLLGIGEQAMSLASVLNFNVAIVVVLVYLAVVFDGPDRVVKRDLIGFGLGLIALMTSGVAVAGIFAIGVTLWARRGLRIAAFHVVPLAAIYLGWYVLFHSPALVVPGVGSPGPGTLLDWVWTGVSTAAKGLVTTTSGGGGPLALLLLGLVVAAFVIGIRDRGLDRMLRDMAAPVALAVGAIGLQLLSGWGRAAFAPDTAAGSRYLYLLVAWSLPLLAVAAQILAERWRIAGLAVCVVLLAGVPWNARQFGKSVFNDAYFSNYRTVVSAIAHDPRLDHVPADVHPIRILLDGPTAGWLRENRGEGGLPEPGQLSDAQAIEVTARLSVGQLNGWAGDDCTSTGPSATTTLERGEVVGVKVPIPQRSLWPGAFISVEVLNGDTVVGRANYQMTAVELFTGTAPRPVKVRFTSLDGSALSLCS